MPHYWIRVSTGTPDPLTGHHNDAPTFEKRFRELVAECRGNARDVFFDADANVAYALVEDNDGDLDLGALAEELSDPKTLRIDLQTADEKQQSTS